LPATGGGNVLARGSALFSKLRDRAQGAAAATDALRQKGGALQQDAAAALASRVSAPKPQALAAIEAARKAAEDAKAQAAAIEQTVRDGLAKGEADVTAMLASAPGQAGKLTGIALKLGEAAKARAAALEAQIRDQLAQAEVAHAAMQISAAALPPVPLQPRLPPMPQDRWASLQSGMPTPTDQALPASGAAGPSAWAGWGSVHSPDADGLRTSMAASGADRWASLRSGAAASRAASGKARQRLRQTAMTSPAGLPGLWCALSTTSISQAAIGTRKSRLMPTPRSFTRSRNWVR
jgi:hypothetical protein